MPGKYYGYRKKSYGYRKKYYGYKKKKFGKYRKISPYSNRIVKSTQRTNVIADKQFIKAKYSIPFTLNLTSQNLLQDDLMGNGFSGSTTIPPGLQNWSAFYTKFRILGSKLKMSFLNESDTPLYVGMLPRTDSNTLNNQDILNQPYCKWRSLGALSGAGRATVKMFMKSKKMFGQKVTQEDDYQGSFNYSGGVFTNATDPVSQWNWTYFVTTDVNVSVAVKVVIELTYYMLLEDRRTQLAA